MSKIDWTKWSGIAEILSAIAIVVTLVYLAAQTQYVRQQTELQVEQNKQSLQVLQQNNEMMRAQTRGELSRDLVGMLLLNINDSAFMDLLRRGNIGEELSELEAVQYENYRNAFIWHWQNIVYQRRMGLYDEEEFSMQMNIIQADMVDLPGTKDHWCSVRYAVSVELINAVEGEELGELC